MSAPAVPPPDPGAVVGAVLAPCSRRRPSTNCRTGPEATCSAPSVRSGPTSAHPTGAAVRGLADPPVPRRGTTTSPPGGGGTTAPPGGGGTTGRVGELARATLNAIDFPSFVSALITGHLPGDRRRHHPAAGGVRDAARKRSPRPSTSTCRTTSPTDAARDYLADRYPTVMYTDVSSGTPDAGGQPERPGRDLPSFFTDLGFDNPAQIDPVSVDEVIVPAARKTMAEQRHQTWPRWCCSGSTGSSSTTARSTPSSCSTSTPSETIGDDVRLHPDQHRHHGRRVGQLDRSPATAIMVNTTNVNAQSDINVRADLTGEVRVQFAVRLPPTGALRRLRRDPADQPARDRAAPTDRRRPPAPQRGRRRRRPPPAAPRRRPPHRPPRRSRCRRHADPWSPRS